MNIYYLQGSNLKLGTRTRTKKSKTPTTLLGLESTYSLTKLVKYTNVQLNNSLEILIIYFLHILNGGGEFIHLLGFFCLFVCLALDFWFLVVFLFCFVFRFFFWGVGWGLRQNLIY